MKIINTKKINYILMFEKYDKKIKDYRNYFLYEAVVDTIPKTNKFVLHDESKNEQGEQYE